MKPVAVNITGKMKQFISETEYTLLCDAEGSVPDTEIKWTQNNRPFKRGKVSSQFKKDSN